VVVYETNTAGRTVVSAIAPLVALGMVSEKAALQDVAREANERLRRALKTLEDAHATGRE